MIRHQRKKQSLPTEQNNSVAPQEPVVLTFLEHVYELRNRFFWAVLVLTITSAAAFQFKDLLITAVMAPLHGQKLIYLTPGGGFSFIFTLCLYFGALFTIPFAIYQVYHFLQPIIGHKSRRFVSMVMFVSTVLAASGALFGYYVTIPAALEFLSTFAGDAVSSSLTADSYLGFVVAYVLGLAALFQLPLLLFIFDHIKPLKPGALSSTQEYVIIGATVLAAVITPTPDAFNMALVAIPIITIYEMGAIAVVIRRQHRKRMARLAAKKAVAAEKKEAVIKPSVTADEPFMADIEDLWRSSSEPTLPDITQKTSMSTPKVVVTTPVSLTETQRLQPHPRMVDGFSTRSRQMPSRTLTPQRSTASLEARGRGMIADRPHRPMQSIDGFSIPSL